MIVACQDTDALVVMEFDEDEDGPQLRYRSSAPVPTPVCLRIA